jgi:hypothetical protein
MGNCGADNYRLWITGSFIRSAHHVQISIKHILNFCENNKGKGPVEQTFREAIPSFQAIEVCYFTQQERCCFSLN